MKEITVAEAAERFNYSVSHLRSLCASGQVKAKRFGKSWAISEKSIARYVSQEHKTGPRPKRKEKER